ncbi:hypothetical protein [Vibrio neptunius]|uniref:hypothetical protein n=1 Tax=Vibrio neptunius TaxID=170651 RepID=UPI001C5CA49E|nr:hypothetical protein [Vibrio neptunius]QXX06783.1 hypothetical protein KW548_01145 [Vibrio neptunius]
MTSKIVFCFPYRGVGGVSLLFSRVASVISLEHEVYVVDYSDGFMARRVNQRVKLIEYNDNSQCKIPDNSVVVFQAMTPWSIFPSLRFGDSTRMFFWHCHPYNLVPSFPYIDDFLKSNKSINRLIYKTLFYGYWKRSRDFLKYLIENDAIGFMDEPNKNTSSYFFKDIIPSNIDYLRIPANSVEVKELSHSKGVMRFGWLGRITDFKFSVLERAIITLDEVAANSECEIEFSVIGSGDYLEYVMDLCKGTSHVKIDFIDYIEPSHLDDFISENIDVMLAMGTSALEAAKLGVPTVLLDFSYEEVPSTYIFSPIFLRNGNTLGTQVSELEDCAFSSQGSYESIMKIVADIESGRFDEYSEKTLHYFKKYHEVDKIAEQLVIMLMNTKANYLDLHKANVCSSRTSLYSLVKRLKRLKRG